MANTMTVERSTTIDAAPERVFALLQDFHEWERWSPWEELDPNMTHTYSGADAGVGAVHEWTGNRKAGQGRMEIVGTDPPRQLGIALTFLKPFKSENTTKFELEPAGTGTTVVWSMVSPVTWMTRIAGIFMNMEKMIGKDFDKGLAKLKSIAEA